MTSPERSLLVNSFPGVHYILLDLVAAFQLLAFAGLDMFLSGKNTRPGQKGITLLELTTALTLIGVMISGGFVGHSMLQNAKAHAVVFQARQLGAAILVFYDKYGVYPGDENNPHIPPNDALDPGNANWRLDPLEQQELFNDLKLAGLITGPFDGDKGFMQHAFEDTITLSWTKAAHSDSPPKHYFVFANLPAEACREIDLKYDDGNPATGEILAGSDYIAGETISKLYYRCQAL